MPDKDFFAEFPPVSKADWLNKVRNDLKNDQLEDFNWEIAEDLSQSPFVHADDFPVAPIATPSSNTSWAICETIEVEDAVRANKEALDALQGGAEALELVFANQADFPAFEALFEGIHPDFIGLHFSGPGVSQNPANVFALLDQILKLSNKKSDSLHGTLYFDPVKAGGIIDWRYLTDLIEFSSDSFPNFSLISLELEANDNPAVSLALLIKRVNEYIVKLAERGVKPETSTRFMHLIVPVGNSYFLEIAKLRALRLLWFNLLKAWEIPLKAPVVHASINSESYSDNLYSNMISGTTAAMSAIMGGVDRLTVLPYDSGRESVATYPKAFSRRIARNVQHLLKLESNLHELNDPAAGSYYIEHLSAKIAEKAWQEFKKLG